MHDEPTCHVRSCLIVIDDEHRHIRFLIMKEKGQDYFLLYL